MTSDGQRLMIDDNKIRIHKDLVVWQKAVDLVVDIYNMT